jgi:hypothetical protein
MKWKFTKMNECMHEWMMVYPKAITQNKHQHQVLPTPNLKLLLVHKSNSQCTPNQKPIESTSKQNIGTPNLENRLSM